MGDAETARANIIAKLSAEMHLESLSTSPLILEYLNAKHQSIAEFVPAVRCCSRNARRAACSSLQHRIIHVHRGSPLVRDCSQISDDHWNSHVGRVQSSHAVLPSGQTKRRRKGRRKMTQRLKKQGRYLDSINRKYLYR